MSEDVADRVMLRIPSGWKDIIKKQAKANRRTMNAEVVLMIETAMRIKGIALPQE